MAKRHKADDAEKEGEEYEFVPPEFDEDAFIHKEMVSFHTTVTLFIAGIVAALLSWAAFAAVDGSRTGWLFGLLIVGAVFVGLRTILRISKIDIEHWGRREWLGTAFLLFFAWLAFFIMFINPPISDFADPDVIVYAPGAASLGDDVYIDVFYTDNGKISDMDFRLEGAAFATFDELDRVTGGHYRMELLDATPGTYTWSASATDNKGREGSTNGTFVVGANVVEVFNADLSVPTNQILVKVPEGVNVWAVYADVQSGGRVFLEFDEKVGGYVATSNFDGWNEGSNNYTVIVEEKNQFQGQSLILGHRISTGPFTTDVSGVGDYDGGEPKRNNPVDPPVRNVPGFEVPLLLAGLVGLGLVARRK